MYRFITQCIIFLSLWAHSFLPRVLFALLGSVPPVSSNICAIIDIGHIAFCSVSSNLKTRLVCHSRQCHNLPANELRVLGSSSIIKWTDAPLPLPGVLFQTHHLPVPTGYFQKKELVRPRASRINAKEIKTIPRCSPNRGNVHLPSV